MFLYNLSSRKTEWKKNTATDTVRTINCIKAFSSGQMIYMYSELLQLFKTGSSFSCTGMFKGVVHFKKKLMLIIYSPTCHPRCPCHSFFGRKEIKVFDENIPGFFSI